ncbi:MAG: elongation factor Ts [Bacteriovoracaceae bacterium]|nr:elongation factor Ts [Bacteriovoracaceae bacterium]
MTQVSATDVKNLRETTGAGMMACKKALEECSGDFEKAIDYLRAKGLAAAAKKQGRIAAEGIVGALVQGTIGTIVEVNCETDFVAKNSDFQKFVQDVSAHIVKNNPADLDVLKSQTLLGAKVTVNDAINEATLKIGEKIDIRRFTTFKLNGSGKIGSYIHNGKIGVLVEMNTDKDVNSNAQFNELVGDLCLHVAAADPRFLSASDIDESYKNREAEIYATQLREQGKDEKMIPNIVKGKLNKLASEVCLLEQKFVKDPDQSIKQLVENVSKAIGAKITVARFAKLNLGEGLEKKQDNLADEVAKMTNNL